MEPIRVIIIGAGNRGLRYNQHMAEMKEHYQVVAVADPDPAHRKIVQDIWGFSEDACYSGWEEILAQPKMADLAVLSTVDNMHYIPALKAIDLGYNLLLEKPVAQTPEECADIARAASEKGVSILVGHVLRYTPFYGRIKDLLRENAIGQVVSAELVEGVGNVHYGHSYVRGNWHRLEDSTPMLLAKCCHDLDIIQWLLDKPCKRVQSFGCLTHFTAENAPEGAPVRCADGGCPKADTCPYNCIKQYVDDKTNRRRKIITTGIAATDQPTDEEVMTSLRTTHYGLCVYHSDNNVVDHQTVNMEFDGGITATLNMNAFNKGGRYIRLFGTEGELYANMKDEQITIYTFSDDNTRYVSVLKTEESINGGHGGGDEGIIKELHEYMSGSYTGYRAADIHVSVKNHLIGFAAEESRNTGTVVDLDTYYSRFGFENK